MNTKTYFERSLCRNARLLSLPKHYVDLLLLLQTNTMTYRQLAMSGLHQGNEAAGRQSLKRLESDGLVQGRSLPSFVSQAKYYSLTSKGKEFLKHYFPLDFLSLLECDFDRRPPSGNQQVLHRIRTNDFYYAYTSGPASAPCPWVLEHPLPQKDHLKKEQPSRCDGLLRSAYCNYYIEQDNATQSVAVIRNKFNQYTLSGLFSPANISKNALVFCLSSAKAQPIARKPSFSLYRILLKFEKAWFCFEKEHGLSIDWLQFLQTLDTSPLQSIFSGGEMEIFLNLKNLHEIDSLSEVTALKKFYLHNKDYQEELLLEMDTTFSKRKKSHFEKACDKQSPLYPLLLAGMKVYAVPNHRLTRFLPFLMPMEYCLPQYLLQTLYYAGLNTDHWEFQMPVFLSGQIPFRFSYGFRKRNTAIIIENIEHDLGGRLRIRHYLQNRKDNFSTVFLVICSRDTAKEYYRSISEYVCSNMRQDTCFCFLDSDSPIIIAQPSSIYILDGNTQLTRAFIDYDDFDDRARIRPSEGGVPV